MLPMNHDLEIFQQFGDLTLLKVHFFDPLQQSKIAMKNGPFIGDFPFNTS